MGWVGFVLLTVQILGSSIDFRSYTKLDLHPMFPFILDRMDLNPLAFTGYNITCKE